MKKKLHIIIFLLFISLPYGLKAQYTYFTTDFGIDISQKNFFYPNYLYFQSANTKRPFFVENIKTRNNNFGFMFRQNIFKSFFIGTGLSYQKTHIEFKSSVLYGDTIFNIDINKFATSADFGVYFVNYKKAKLYISAGIEFNYNIEYKETESLTYFVGYTDDPMGGQTANYDTDINDIENEFVGIIYPKQKTEYHYTAEIGALLNFWRITFCPALKYHYVSNAIIINQDDYHYFTINIRFGIVFFHEKNRIYIE